MAAELEPLPSSFSTFTLTNLAFGATPDAAAGISSIFGTSGSSKYVATLNLRCGSGPQHPAMMPATCVPWPYLSSRDVDPEKFLLNVVSIVWNCWKCGWSDLMPLSSTAQVMPSPRASNVRQH